MSKCRGNRVFIDGNLPVYNSGHVAELARNAMHQTMVRAGPSWNSPRAWRPHGGRHRRQRSRTLQMLGEIWSYAELRKAAVHSGEEGAYEYGNGAWFLDRKPLDALRACCRTGFRG